MYDPALTVNLQVDVLVDRSGGVGGLTRVGRGVVEAGVVDLQAPPTHQNTVPT